VSLQSRPAAADSHEVDEDVETASRTTTRAARRINADPTSTALLLAGPAALELWPGVRRVGESAGRAVVATELTGWPTSATVRALPPQRTPTAFVTRFEWVGAGLPVTTGELTLGYAPGVDGTPSTSAQLTLHSDSVVGSRVDPAALQHLADGFLANLAQAAESRSHAA
jgi:hypothetical protein